MEAVAVLVPLALLGYLIVRSGTERFRSRRCPRCGWRVANGMMDCPHCDFDFRQVGR